MTTRTRVLIGVVGAVVAINLALAGVDRIAGGPRGGPPSSSYNAGARGLAAYADLLRRAGHGVVQLRRSLAGAPLDPRSTVVVLDASITADDAHALARFVQEGGRLICGGFQTLWLRELVSDPPSLAPLPIDDAVPIAPVPEVAGVEHVRSFEPAAWTRTHSALPALGSSGLYLLAVENFGAGRIDFLASASPLQDALLATDDDAAFGLALAGPVSRPVVFAENAHGFGDTGWRAIPAPARWTLFVLFLAALGWIASRIRRLGPPMPSERPLPPPRRLFVESLAQTLARTRGRRSALAPLRAAARDRVTRLAALPRDAGDAEVREAALRFGLDATEASAIVGHPADDAGVVAVGRAYAKLERGPRR